MARRGRPASTGGSNNVAGGIGTSEGNPGSNSDAGLDFSGHPAIDPAAIDGATASGSSGDGDGSPAGNGDKPRRKYTRRTGAKASKAIPVDVLSSMLFTGHAMLAGIVRVEELQLSMPESEQLAVAMTTVSQFYNVEVAEKTMAWINLAMVGGMIYGTRLVAIRSRRIAERRERREQQPEQKAPEYGGVPDGYMPGFDGPVIN